MLSIKQYKDLGYEKRKELLITLAREYNLSLEVPEKVEVEHILEVETSLYRNNNPQKYEISQNIKAVYSSLKLV